MLKEINENYQEWTDDDLTNELNVILGELLDRLDQDVIRSDGKEMLENGERRTNQEALLESNNYIQVLKAVRTVTHASLIDARRLVNHLGYAIRSFNHFRD